MSASANRPAASIGALLLASFIAGSVMLLNLWVAYGPAGSMKLSADRNVLTFFGAAATFGIAMAIAEQFARLSERRQLWPSLVGGVVAFALAFGCGAARRRSFRRRPTIRHRSW